MKRRPIVCLDFPAAEDGPFRSVRTFVAMLDSTLGAAFSLVTPPSFIEAMPRAKRDAVYADLLRRSAVVITSSPLRWLTVRAASGIRCPCVFLPLGEGPRGASKLRNSLSRFTGQDVIAFSSTAERGVFDVLVRSCAARPFMLPFFVDTDFFAPIQSARRQAVRAALSLTDEQVLILYTGRITAEKNVHTLLALTNILVHAHRHVRLLVVGVPDARFVFRTLGGSGVDLGAVVRRILASSEPLARRVAFTRQTVSNDDLKALYGAADIFANLTLHHDENFGYTQVEAMSSGLPVVCTDWGGLKDTVAHGETGFRVATYVGREGPRVDLWAGFQYCSRLVRDADLRRTFGAAGRERALQEYAIPVFRKRLEDLVSFACRQPASTAWQRNSLTPLGRTFDRRFRAPHATESFAGGEPLVTKGSAISARFTRSLRRYYEPLLVPFCSGRYREDFADDTLVFWPVLSFWFRRREIVIEDPLVPGRYAIDDAARALLRFLDRRLTGGHPFTTVSDLRRARLVPEHVLHRRLRGLLRKGILMVSHPRDLL